MSKTGANDDTKLKKIERESYLLRLGLKGMFFIHLGLAQIDYF
jgi:hypothetical protein